MSLTAWPIIQPDGTVRYVRQVVIEVSENVAHVLAAPADVRVTVIDYDQVEVDFGEKGVARVADAVRRGTDMREAENLIYGGLRREMGRDG